MPQKRQLFVYWSLPAELCDDVFFPLSSFGSRAGVRSTKTLHAAVVLSLRWMHKSNSTIMCCSERLGGQLARRKTERLDGTTALS